MNAFWDNGINIQGKEFKLILDPDRIARSGLVGVSHAHGDHLRDHRTHTLLTPETAAFSKTLQKPNPLNYGEKYKLDGTELTLHNANHILGSAQFRISAPEETIVYTGDMRLSESLFLGGCDVLQCDKLIIETTYGLPHFKFPAISQVAADMEKWVKGCLRAGKNVMFGAYPLGKSQEIIAILNSFGVEPAVHSQIAAGCDIYRRNGVKLDYHEQGTDGQFVAVVPNRLLDADFAHVMAAQTKRKTATALATGWGSLWNFPGVERVFLLSDHADFYQLMDYVKRSGARKVFTVHGYTEEFAKEVNHRLGVDARPLEMSGQKTLVDF
jgi:putative mRNA 3-end processing factor